MTKEEHNINTSNNQEEYDRVLENINASLKKDKKEDRNGLRKLHLKKNEEAGSKSKYVVKQTQERDVQKSFYKNNADIR